MEDRRGWKRISRGDRPNVAAKGRSLRVKAGGFDLGCLVTPVAFSRREGWSGVVSLFLDFGVRAVQLAFGDGCCIAFHTRELEDFILLGASDQPALFLTLRHPPRLYNTASSEELEFATRLTSFDAATTGLTAFGSCRTIRLVFNPGQFEADEDTVLNTVLNFLTAVEKHIYEAAVSPWSPQTPCSFAESLHSGSLEVQGAWRVLASSSGFVEERFTTEFFTKLNSCSPKLAARLLYALTRLSSRDRFLNPVSGFDDALKHVHTLDDVHDTRLHCRVPRLVLTPTRRIFYEAEVIQSNRVLREWGPKAQFLRVTIRDEDFSKLSVVKGKLSVVLNEIFHQLKAGLMLGNRIFKFLGCSNNQIRDHGCFFVDATDQDQIVQDIRYWAGSLDRIHNVAQYVSRLGQVFSTSTNTVKVDVKELQKIPDITENGYCFTDGIGKIAPDLAQEVALKLGLKRAIPCAFQIRFGGCKGVVAVDVNLQQSGNGRRLFVRDSMLKYWSSHMNIEVLSSCARPQELYLNQQLIMLLSHLGVDDRVFMKLLHESLDSLSTMFIDEEVARRKLRSVECGIDWGLVEKTNFLVTTDPYLRSMLMALYRVQMKGLREKSKIPVNASDARLLIGTVDESRTLEYGQVFVQISKHVKNPGVEKIMLQRKVVIGKSPCLHPGDVRTFDAVDCPALHHMCDCVVFPSKGPRPHPNELSGSDLDGDLYHVIWGEYLLPSKSNVTPMDYTASTSHTYHDKITSHEMLQFLRQNIENDCLGQIDNTHKALADQKGIDNQYCLQLAKLHSQAVDAPKTGQWTSVPKEIRKALDKYPDFMLKQDRPSYPSEKVLGMIHRECTKFFNTSSIQSSSLQSVDEALSQTLLGMEAMEPFLEEARRLRKQYNGKLRALMSMYGVSTEAEVMSGFVEKVHEKMDKETYDTTSLISHLKAEIIQKYRDRFFRDERIQECGLVTERKALCKAAAWYHVCYSPTELCETYTVGKTTSRFLSFAWIPSEYLLKLYAQSRDSEKVDGAKERLGRSVYDLLSRSSRRILNIFEEQLLIKSPLPHTVALQKLCRDYVEEALSESKTVLKPYLYGLSYNLLFDERHPETELVLWFPGLEPYLFESIPMTPPAQREHSHFIKTTLNNCGIDARSVMCGQRTLLFFHCTVSAIGRNVRAHVALDPLCWIQSALLLEYIYHYPWLLPLLRVIIKWACTTEFVGSVQNALIDSLSVCFMLVDYLLRTGDISQVLDSQTVLESIKAAKFDEYASLDTWQEVLDRLFSMPPATAPMGGLLLGFFADHEHWTTHPVHPSLQSVLGHNNLYSMCSMRSMMLLQEEMQRAFHKLCFHCTILPLFVPCQTVKVLHLESEFAQRMQGSEQFFARLYSRQTRTSVEVHEKGDRAGGLLFKITGTGTGIHAVEKLLDQFKEKSRCMDKITYRFPGVMEIFAVGSQRYIVEGTGRNNDAKMILLEDFCGARHPVDDNIGLYALRVYAPTEPIPEAMYNMRSSKFSEFKAFFLERLQLLQRSEEYSLFLHGPLTFEILFGKFYISSPTKEMMEDPEGISCKQVVLHLSGSNRKVIPEMLKWKEEIEKSARAPCATQGQRDAFFPKLHQAISGAALEQLLSDYGLEEVGVEESYVLSLRGERHGVVANYKSDLTLSSVSYPPIRWMAVNIKRFFRELTEMDIRYDISSNAPCKTARVLDMVNCTLLKKHPRPHSMPALRDLFMPVVYTLKHVAKRTFQYKGERCALFWRAVKLELSEVTVQSRPRETPKPEFGMTERFLDLRMNIDLSLFQNQLPDDAFVSEMWYQAAYLSDMLAKLADRRRG